MTDVQAVAVQRNVKTETGVSCWCSRHPVSECRRQAQHTPAPLSADEQQEQLTVSNNRWLASDLFGGEKP